MEDKNIKDMKDYKRANPFNNIFHKSYENNSHLMSEKPEDMGAGGQAIDKLLNMPLSQIEALVKAQGETADPGSHAGRSHSPHQQ